MAFFFNAIGTQGPKKEPKENQKNPEDNGDESDSEHSTSQVSSSSSQSWISSHPSLLNKKLLPAAIKYWIALSTPNGALANPITIHRALFECGVDAVATVHLLFVHHKLIVFTNARIFEKREQQLYFIPKSVLLLSIFTDFRYQSIKIT